MKSRWNLIFSVGALALASSTVTLATNAELYKHVVNLYPGDLDQCRADLANIEARFEQQNTGVEVYGANCFSGVRGRSIEISYVAEQPVEAVRLEDRSIYAGRLGYATREACDQALVHEVSVFRDETGLEPFLDYCQFDEERFNDVYVPYIEAFGQAERRPYVYTSLFGRSPSEDLQAFISRVKEKTHLDAARVSTVQFYKDFSGLYIHMIYYNEAKLRLDIKEVIGFASFEACDQERRRLEQEMAVTTGGADGRPMFLFCSVNWQKKFFLESFQNVSGHVFKPTLAPDVFSSKQACTAKQDEVVSFYREVLGKEVTGSVCGDRNGASRLALFVR